MCQRSQLSTRFEGEEGTSNRSQSFCETTQSQSDNLNTSCSFFRQQTRIHNHSKAHNTQRERYQPQLNGVVQRFRLACALRLSRIEMMRSRAERDPGAEADCISTVVSGSISPIFSSTLSAPLLENSDMNSSANSYEFFSSVCRGVFTNVCNGLFQQSQLSRSNSDFLFRTLRRRLPRILGGTADAFRAQFRLLG